MADTISNPTIKRYAVVTKANKEIGLEVVRQLASKQVVVVVLTARDEKKRLEAVEKLKPEGCSSDYVVFHQLDVTDPDSCASLADLIKSKFGKLDILNCARYMASKQSTGINFLQARAVLSTCTDLQLQGVDNSIRRSKKTWTEMARRMDRNRIAGFIIAALALSITTILYFKMSH